MCVSVGSRGTRQELTKSKKCRSSRLQGYSLRPRTRALRLTRRAMASAEGEWAEYFRTSALVYDAVECLDRIGGLDDPPGAPRLHDAEDEHVFGMALRYHAAHVAKRVAAARRESAAAAVSHAGGGASARDGASLGRRLGYLPRQLDEIELDHGRRVTVPVDDDDDDARVVALTRHMRQLPKLELHAHLNGCVRDSTLLDRAEAVARAAEDDDAPARTEEESTAEDENDRTGANKTPKPPPKPPRKTAADVRALLAKPDGKGRPLQRCFDLFAAIHDLCTDHESLRRIAAEATMDFARDGVVYLELRTTPKCVPSRNVTKASYCAAVLDGLALGKKLADDYWRRRQQAGSDDDEGGTSAAADRTGGPSSNSSSNASSFESFAICARLILSVDRRETPEEAVKTVKLAAFLRDAGADVCGVDLSGNPALGHWKSFEPALRLARHLKLSVTLHCGEIRGTGAEEAAMIAFAPERFGHCVQTSRDPERWLALRRSEIPIEICVSSNVVTDSVPYDENCDGGWVSRARRHHVGQVHAVGHPSIICTDDPRSLRDDALARVRPVRRGVRPERRRREGAGDCLGAARVHDGRARRPVRVHGHAGQAAGDAGRRELAGFPGGFETQREERERELADVPAHAADTSGGTYAFHVALEVELAGSEPQCGDSVRGRRRRRRRRFRIRENRVWIFGVGSRRRRRRGGHVPAVSQTLKRVTCSLSG